MSGYTDQPPPSTGTLQPPSVNQGGPNLPATGSDIAPLVGLGVIAAVVGAAIAGAARRRNPWASQERQRTRDFDRLARESRQADLDAMPPKWRAEHESRRRAPTGDNWKPLP